MEEAERDGQIRLSLHGELDRASTRVLEDRLTSLSAKKRSVRLDLSKLEFIDSTGLHLLIRAMRESRMDGWKLQIEPDVSLTGAESKEYELVQASIQAGMGRLARGPGRGEKASCEDAFSPRLPDP